MAAMETGLLTFARKSVSLEVPFASAVITADEVYAEGVLVAPVSAVLAFVDVFKGYMK